MTTKRATLLTINSLTALSKVCSSFNSLDAIKTSTLVKTFSTATEAASYFQNPNGNDVENPSEYYEISSPSYSENPNFIEFQQKPNGHFPARPYTDEFYRGNAVEVQQGLNSNGGLRENPRTEYSHNPVRQNGKFDGHYGASSGENPNGFYLESSRVFKQCSGGVYGEIRDIQNLGSYNEGNGIGRLNPIGSDGQRVAGPLGSVDGNHGENVGQSWQRSVNQRAGAYQSATFGEYRQSPNGYYGENVKEYQPIPNGHVNFNNVGKLKQSPSYSYTTYQHQENVVEYQQSLSGHNRENVGETQGLPNGNVNNNVGHLQPSPGGCTGNTGPYQPTPNENVDYYNTGQLQHSRSDYYMMNSRTYQHQENVGDYHMSSKGYYREHVGETQVATDGNADNNVGHSQQSPSDNWTGNTGPYQSSPNGNVNYYNAGQLQQSHSDFYTRNTRTHQHQENIGEYQRSSNGYNSENAGENQCRPDGNVGNNAGHFQQNMSENYLGNARAYRHREPDVKYGENNGDYQQSPKGKQSSNGNNNIVGELQQDTSESQNGMVSSQIFNNFKHDGDSVEATENSQCRGTLEELDGFCKEGKVKEALGLLEKQGNSVDLPRLLWLMRVCGEAKAIQEAKSVHEYIIRSASPLKISTYNRILEMYSKCGSMEDAFNVFNKMPGRNLTSWDTMITWLAKNGLGEDAIDLFTQFKRAGLQPDAQLFVGVFSACSVLGDVDEGMLHFETMSKEYGIVPSMMHYVSVVDMLGSSGYLDEALEFIEKMPLQPSVDVWETLMNLCRIHGNSELGDRCAELVELLDSSRLTEQSKAGLIPVVASDIAKEKERKKSAGQLLEVKSRVHEYRAGDTSHPEAPKIYEKLRGLKAHLKEAGYVPQTRFMLHDVDEESKEEALLTHSEKLAFTYGLLSSPPRQCIRVIKNLRVCGDCHAALKIVSKIVGRELIMRDAKRFHHIKDGVCSCHDYW